MRYFLLVAVSMATLTGLSACDSSRNDRSGPRQIQVGAQSLLVDFLLTNEQRMNGVVRRSQIETGEGVLFVYPEPVPNLHWANRTLLEQVLQVAFIGPEGTIRRIERVPPDRERPVSAEQTVQFLLVVPDGWFGKYGISKNDRVDVPGDVIQSAHPVFSIANRERIFVGDKRIQVELARTPAQREQGLMHRKVLPENQGMLFVYRNADYRNFHMKNTLIPLDIAFVDGSGTIQEIKQMEPLNTGNVSSSRPATYVLEMRQGWFRDHGIGSGTKMDLSSITHPADGNDEK